MVAKDGQLECTRQQQYGRRDEHPSTRSFTSSKAASSEKRRAMYPRARACVCVCVHVRARLRAFMKIWVRASWGRGRAACLCAGTRASSSALILHVRSSYMQMHMSFWGVASMLSRVGTAHGT